jgi:hypothetical protein
MQLPCATSWVRSMYGLGHLPLQRVGLAQFPPSASWGCGQESACPVAGDDAAPQLAEIRSAEVGVDVAALDLLCRRCCTWNRRYSKPRPCSRYEGDACCCCSLLLPLTAAAAAAAAAAARLSARLAADATALGLQAYCWALSVQGKWENPAYGLGESTSCLRLVLFTAGIVFITAQPLLSPWPLWYNNLHPLTQARGTRGCPLGAGVSSSTTLSSLLNTPATKTAQQISQTISCPLHHCTHCGQ